MPTYWRSTLAKCVTAVDALCVHRLDGRNRHPIAMMVTARLVPFNLADLSHGRPGKQLLDAPDGLARAKGADGIGLLCHCVVYDPSGVEVVRPHVQRADSPIMNCGPIYSAPSAAVC
jgi:hypothetical protein